MKTSIYLNFGGNCAEAFRFYQEHLGAQIIFSMPWSQMPDADKHMPPGYADKILHASMVLGGTGILGADIPGFQPIRSAYVTLNLDSSEEAERIYNTLSEGGEIHMKMTETFFAYRFAQFTDRFGVKWMVLHSKNG